MARMTIDLHRSRIGASMAPAVCGCSPYENGTPLGAYLYFTGAIEGPEETPEMAWGTMVEDSIRRHAEQHFGRRIVVPDPRIHADYPFMGASPDGAFGDGEAWGGTSTGLEIKNVTDPERAREWKEAGTDAVPENVMVQCQQQIAVFGFAAVEVALSLFGRPPVYYHVPRSEEIIRSLIRIEADFWRRVQERRPPEPDWSHPDTPALVQLMTRPEKGKTIQLGDNFTAAVRMYRELGEQKKAAEKGQDLLKGQMIAGLGDAEIGVLPDGGRLRRRIVAALPPAMSKGRKEYFQLDILKGE